MDLASPEQNLGQKTNVMSLEMKRQLIFLFCAIGFVGASNYSCPTQLDNCSCEEKRKKIEIRVCTLERHSHNSTISETKKKIRNDKHCVRRLVCECNMMWVVIVTIICTVVGTDCSSHSLWKRPRKYVPVSSREGSRH